LIPFVRLPGQFAANFADLATALRAEWSLRSEDRKTRTVVLARFIQILPDTLCRRAFERGVKLIGATCHYATADLDAGPFIEQEVARVEHYHDPEDLVRLGRDLERLALARGVCYHVEDCVLVHGSKAIVFRD
jgi:formyltetrahydrofolate deformylase